MNALAPGFVPRALSPGDRALGSGQAQLRPVGVGFAVAESLAGEAGELLVPAPQPVQVLLGELL